MVETRVTKSEQVACSRCAWTQPLSDGHGKSKTFTVALPYLFWVRYHSGHTGRIFGVFSEKIKEPRHDARDHFPPITSCSRLATGVSPRTNPKLPAVSRRVPAAPSVTRPEDWTKDYLQRHIKRVGLSCLWTSQSWLMVTRSYAHN